MDQNHLLFTDFVENKAINISTVQQFKQWIGLQCPRHSVGPSERHPIITKSVFFYQNEVFSEQNPNPDPTRTLTITVTLTQP